MEYTIKRRTLVKGAAWVAPVVVAASAVPAYAASQCDPSTAGTSSYSGLTGSANGVEIPLVSGEQEVNSYTISISQTADSFTQPTNWPDDIRNGSFTFGGFRGQEGDTYDENNTVIPKEARPHTLDREGVSLDTTKGIVLTQARLTPTQPSSQTVTYTFKEPVYSFSLPIYDLTYAYTEGKWGYQTYRDVVIFSQNVTITGPEESHLEGLNSTSGTTFFRTSMLPTSQEGNQMNALTATYSSSTPISEFSITYTDDLTENVGWQSIAFGPISTSC